MTDVLDEFDLADEVDNASDVPHVVMMAGNNFLVDTRALEVSGVCRSMETAGHGHRSG